MAVEIPQYGCASDQAAIDQLTPHAAQERLRLPPAERVSIQVREVRYF